MKEGFDVGLEMSGNPDAFRDMLANMCHGGKIAMLGIPTREIAIDWNTVVFNMITIKGIYGREMYETWYKMTVMLQSGLDISPVITHRYDFRDFQKGFDAMKSGAVGQGDPDLARGMRSDASGRRDRRSCTVPCSSTSPTSSTRSARPGCSKASACSRSPQQAHVGVEGGADVLNMCANNYLGLADHPEVVHAAHDALDRWGNGMASVRFICGTQEPHKELEKAISEFLGTEDTILYSSCWDANGGLFETILGAEDAVISDELNHASIIDGIRLCKATAAALQEQRHGRPGGEAQEAARRAVPADRDRRRVLDGRDHRRPQVDLRPGRKVRCPGDGGRLACRRASWARHGRGTHEYCDVMGRVDIITGTLGKALGGASGGYTSGRAEIVALLRQRSRPYLFSNSVAPPILGASLKAIEICTPLDRAARPARGRTPGFSAPQMTQREVQHRSGRAPDHADHDRRRRPGREDGGAVARERRLCDRLLLPRRASGKGPRSRAGLGRTQPRGPGIRDRGVHEGARRAGDMRGQLRADPTEADHQNLDARA